MKSITIATILLVVVFALAVVGFAQPRPEGFEPGMGGGPGGAGPLATLPDLTDEQMDAIDTIHENHRAEMESTREKMMPLGEALHEEMIKPEPDTATVRELMTKMNDIEIEMMIYRLEMRQSVRGLLTAEQLAVFDAMPREMGDRGPHHGGGVPMHGDGPGCGAPGWRG